MYLTTTNTAQFSLYHITCVNFDAILAWLPCVFLCFVKTISPGLECSLYADDFLICYRSKYIHITERHIQQCLNKLSDSADTNSFKFSSSKLYACISADFTNCTRILRLHWMDHPFLLLKKLNFLVSYSIANSRFYSTSTLLAMQSAVLARGILSVRPSVCPSFTFRYYVQTNEDTIVRFSASGRTIPLVSGEVKFIRIFAGVHPQRGR